MGADSRQSPYQNISPNFFRIKCSTVGEVEIRLLSYSMRSEILVFILIKKCYVPFTAFANYGKSFMSFKGIFMGQLVRAIQ